VLVDVVVGGIDPEPVALLVVAGEVLGGRDHVLALQALDLCDGHLRGQIRVLAESLGHPAPVGHAQDVDGRRQGHVVPLANVLGAERRPILLRQVGVEGRCVGLGHREGGHAGVAVADPVRAIGQVEIGNAEPRDPRHMPGEAGRAERVAVDQRDLLVQRQLADQAIRLPLGVLPGDAAGGRRRGRPGGCGPGRPGLGGGARRGGDQGQAGSGGDRDDSGACRPPVLSSHI
jgi:hypothetical protein